MADSNPKSETPKVELVTVTLDDIFKPGLSYKYPKGWSERRSSSGDVPVVNDGSTIQNSILTSADKTVDITIMMGVGGGLGGACNPDEVNKLDLFGYEVSKNLSEASYVEYISRDKYTNDQWVVQQGLGATKDVTSIKAGDSSCSVMYATTISSSKFTNIGLGPILRTSISVHDKDERLSFPTLDEAKAYLNSDTAEKIKQIFLSVK